MKKIFLLLAISFLLTPLAAQTQTTLSNEVNEAVYKLQLGDKFSTSLLYNKIQYIRHNKFAQGVDYEKVEINEKFTKYYFWIQMDYNDFKHVFICVSNNTDKVLSIYSRTNSRWNVDF
jgi:hypothetical protein